MASRSQEDDGDETEMSGLQSHGKPNKDSEDEHHANEREDDPEPQSSNLKLQREKDAAYRK